MQHASVCLSRGFNSYCLLQTTRNLLSVCTQHGAFLRAFCPKIYARRLNVCNGWFARIKYPISICILVCTVCVKLAKKDHYLFNLLYCNDNDRKFA